ncbi:Transposase DDE domain protein [Luteitalea pratensis]|uniref:Transposase DDE domain protein n=1 Tax=Luteitalea pratensis TaxID=1855912 RepID=A0A143PM58_LUTPR|nr:IS5 family transposase [Luteitalea pratensis]AMY09581.1 Transposase DDE domain protein [Luteitalea pratensis]
MKSRVHPTYKTHYRVGNWRAYECALVSRGDVTLWLSPEARAAWIVPPSGQPGGQQRFSDVAIETVLTLRLLFRMPLRQTEGFVRSILTVMRAGLDAPDHTTLSRRSQLLDVVHNIPATGPLHVIVDRTGLSVVGEGEWAATKHGGRGRRGWKKLHLGVGRSGVTVAHVLTEATVDDAIDLIGAAVGDIASVTADAAYDTVAFYEAASGRHAQVVVPPITTARGVGAWLTPSRSGSGVGAAGMSAACGGMIVG